VREENIAIALWLGVSTMVAIILCLIVLGAWGFLDRPRPDQPEPPAITLHIEENVFGALCKACPTEED
jgi:hypothetical protein